MAAANRAWEETRRKDNAIAASTEDHVVASTARGEIRGARYPHILNHVSIYTIPSIDEVLNLYHESQSANDHMEPIYPGSFPRQSQHKGDSRSIVASIARAYAGTDGPEVVGPGSQLYNLRNTYLPESSVSGHVASVQSHEDSGNSNARRDSWESTPSLSDSDDSIYLSTIFEEPEPAEVGVDVGIVKPSFRTRWQREVLMGQGTSAKDSRPRISGHRF